MEPIDELLGDHAFAITPSDSEDLPTVARVIRVGTAGNLKVMTRASDIVTIPNCYAGEIINYVRVKRVYATVSGTAAASLVGFW
jgi:purine-nucleoside phosphorylase